MPTYKHDGHTLKSKFELNFYKYLEDQGYSPEYENLSLDYTLDCVYTPDFILQKKDGEDMIIETKGKFDAADRRKHKVIKEQYPDLDIRIVFMNPAVKITKKSKTSYLMWCKKNGITASPLRGKIPKDWIRELKL